MADQFADLGVKARIALCDLEWAHARADSGNWTLPGGMQDLGESITQTAVREVREETGLDVELTGLIGIYTDPGHQAHHPRSRARQGAYHLLRAPSLSKRVFANLQTEQAAGIRPRVGCARSSRAATWPADPVDLR
jgi:ADP-ribose pyrophosphatase YjhB (NUDIX family)